MEINKDHILSYLEKTLPEEDRQAFEAQLSQSENFRKEVEDTRFVLEQTRLLRQQRAFRTADNWNVLSHRIRNQELRVKVWNFIRNVAAMLLVPVLVLSAYLYFSVVNDDKQTVETVEVVAASGLISKVVLPDSSIVWLNSESTISYPREFKDGIRQVQLSGEAYFKVKADPENRFDVSVGDQMTVSAYGTEFNVNAYKDDLYIEALLTEGHIEVTDNKASKKSLVVGQSASLDREHLSEGLQVVEANIYVKTAWKDGKMVFRRAGFEEIAKRLARHFNADIVLQSKALFEYEYSATFTTETLAEILSLLEKSAPIKCEIIEPEKNSDLSYNKRKVIITEKK